MTTRRLWALWSKPPKACHGAVERALACMTERRMAEVVRQRQRLGQILVEAQLPRHRARDLSHLEAVRQARPVVIALVVDEHLRLVDQAAEGGRVQNSVAVALKGAPGRTGGLLVVAPTRGDGACRIGGRRAFTGLQRLSVGEIGRIRARTSVFPLVFRTLRQRRSYLTATLLYLCFLAVFASGRNRSAQAQRITS